MKNFFVFPETMTVISERPDSLPWDEKKMTKIRASADGDIGGRKLGIIFVAVFGAAIIGLCLYLCFGVFPEGVLDFAKRSLIGFAAVVGGVAFMAYLALILGHVVLTFVITLYVRALIACARAYKNAKSKRLVL